MHLAIRPTVPGDLELLRELERRAGERFRDVGRAEVADDEPLAVQALATYVADGRSWVAVGEDDVPIGYVLVDVVDGNAHVEQVSVRPDHQGRGVGRALLEQVRHWAVERAMPLITLTTFTDVPWNAPLYRHLGFEVLADGDIGPELRARQRAEAAHGLDPDHRVAMRRNPSPSQHRG